MCLSGAYIGHVPLPMTRSCSLVLGHVPRFVGRYMNPPGDPVPVSQAPSPPLPLSGSPPPCQSLRRPISHWLGPRALDVSSDAEQRLGCFSDIAVLSQANITSQLPDVFSALHGLGGCSSLQPIFAARLESRLHPQARQSGRGSSLDATGRSVRLDAGGLRGWRDLHEPVWRCRSGCLIVSG